MLDKDNLNETLADAVMDRPRELFIDKRRYCLWSPSLGMSMILSRHLSELDVDSELLAVNPSMEALRLSKVSREQVCHILAIHSFRSCVELCNSTTIKRRARLYSSRLTYEELAQLLLFVLSEPKAETLISLTGIDKEQQEQSKIAKFKSKGGHTKSYGGKTVYGNLILPACELLNLTPHQVVWDISLLNLRMLLADRINSVYLSDEDMDALGMPTDSKDTFGMSENDFAQLKALYAD